MRSRGWGRGLLSLLGALALGSSREARASEPASAPKDSAATPAAAQQPEVVAPRSDGREPFSIGAKPAWFLLGGVTTGGTLVTHDRGFYVGGELSLVRLREGRFVGLYGDGYYDFGIHRTYTTAGVELGYKLLGIDGGAAARVGGDRIEWGPTGRLFIGLGLVSLYIRYAYFPEPLAVGNDHVLQIGALLKLPLFATGGPDR